MKKQILILAVPLTFGLAGCEFQSFKDYEIPPYDGDFTWTRVTANAPWCNRQDLGAAEFNNKLWVLGGYNPGMLKGDTYLEDIWSSGDGKEWTLVEENAPWRGRRGHAVLSFDDGTGEALYLIGGFSVDESTGYRQYENDVWKSTDGKNWVCIKERTVPPMDSLYDWYPRMNHAVVKANHGGVNYLYLIGGSTMMETGSARYAYQYFNDVWRSADGIHWEDLHSDNYGIRAGHAATVDPQTGRIYIQGGLHGVIFDGEGNSTVPIPNWSWLWSSADGQHWTAENDTAGFEQGYLSRTEHQMAFYKGTLYAFPGATNSNQHFHFALKEFVTMWKREPGNLWLVDSNGSDTDARYSYGLIEHDHKIWILGGDTNASGPANDVWVAEIK
jgi:hypothetical protein